MTSNRCACGRRPLELPGLRCCRLCYHEHYHSRRYYGGQREAVLNRDRCCLICGKAGSLIVHHRRPGIHDRELLIALCAGCHARVHRSRRLKAWVPALLLELWVEAHPRAGIQLQLELGGTEEGHPAY